MKEDSKPLPSKKQLVNNAKNKRILEDESEESDEEVYMKSKISQRKAKRYVEDKENENGGNLSPASKMAKARLSSALNEIRPQSANGIFQSLKQKYVD